MLRSIGSVLAGIAALTIASFAIEAVINPLLLKLFPEALPGPDALLRNPWVRMLTFTYGILCVAAGGYVTAKVAKRSSTKHAAAMGIVQATLTIAAMLSPEGYRASKTQWIAIALLSIPAALAGDFLYQKRSELAT